MRKSLRTAAGLAFLFPLAGTAGVVIEQEQHQPGNGAPLLQTAMYIEEGKLRVESKSADGEESITIFDQAKQVVWVIDPAARTYYEMTPEQIQRMKRRMDQARKEMETQLAGLPPEQRRMIEEMMKQQMPKPPSVSVEQVSRGEKVGQFTCTRYRLLSDGELSGEVWAASSDQLQLRDSEYETFRALGRFFEPLGRSAPIGTGWVQSGPQIEGVPVRWVSYTGSRAVAEDRMVKVERRSLDAKLFALPAGLEKSEIELEP